MVNVSPTFLAKVLGRLPSQHDLVPSGGAKGAAGNYLDPEGREGAWRDSNLEELGMGSIHVGCGHKRTDCTLNPGSGGYLRDLSVGHDAVESVGRTLLRHGEVSFPGLEDRCRRFLQTLSHHAEGDNGHHTDRYCSSCEDRTGLPVGKVVENQAWKRQGSSWPQPDSPCIFAHGLSSLSSAGASAG